MNTSVESLQKEIKQLQNKIREAKGADLSPLLDKRKELLNDLHNKKLKSRQQLVVRKIKEAAAEQEIEDSKPEVEIRYITKEVPKEIIREVPIEVPVEVIKEVPVYITTNDGIPDALDVKSFAALLNQVREVYINTNSPIKIGDIVETADGQGIVKSLVIEEEEIHKKGGGIFAKVKRIRKNDGKEGERFMGSDRRGYLVTNLILIERKEKTIKKK